MVKVLAFSGLRYNVSKIEDIGKVIAPPYDVISEKLQDQLYSRSDYNVVRLILEKIYPDDDKSNSRYTRSKATLDKWIDEKVLVFDDQEKIYLLAQEFSLKGEIKRRVGIIVRRYLDNLGDSIYPHERTLKGPKIDRLELTRACRANFSQIFGIYHDPYLKLDDIWQAYMTANDPDIDTEDTEGNKVKFWAISDLSIIERVKDFFETLDIVIADGHHRYETALAYKQERLDQGGSSQDSFNYVMTFLANSASEGFEVLPTHRVLMNSVKFDKKLFHRELGRYFSLSKIEEGGLDSLMSRLQSRSNDEMPYIGYISEDIEYYLLKFKNKEGYLSLLSDLDEPEVLKMLDVSLLQNLIFENMLSLTREKVASKVDVKFTIDEKEALSFVEKGSARAAFLLNSIDIAKVYDIARRRNVMPQKSTYFYPKLPSGLVINCFD